MEADTVLNGRYRIVKVLGTGGMSNVYLVEDEKLNSRWALKELLNIFPDEEKEEFLEQFKKEAQILAGIKHPNLPRVFDYFEEKDRNYLVMEFIEGVTLDELLERKESIPVETVLDWGVQICDVLQSLHDNDIIYRDLKPSNIMVGEENRIFIVDFGIARFFTGGKLKDTMIIGTPGFAPPEQHGRAQTDPRSDIYSLGSTLHYLLTGHDPGLTPFVFKEPHTLNPGLSESISKVVMQALELDPEKRYQSASKMKRELRKLVPNLYAGETEELEVDSSPGDEEETLKKDGSDTAVMNPEEPEVVSRPTAGFGGITFACDPVKSYGFPLVISGGSVSTAALLLTGGVVTLPVAGFVLATMVPATIIIKKVVSHLSKDRGKIAFTVSEQGIEIKRQDLNVFVPWNKINKLLIFKEPVIAGLSIRKYKIFTERGNYEYTDEIHQVERLNDLIITRAGLSMVADETGYKRYAREEN